MDISRIQFANVREMSGSIVTEGIIEEMICEKMKQRCLVSCHTGRAYVSLRGETRAFFLGSKILNLPEPRDQQQGRVWNVGLKL